MEEKTNKILIFRNHMHLMKFPQLKVLEAGERLEKYNVILSLTFLWAYIYNHCPETGC